MPIPGSFTAHQRQLVVFPEWDQGVLQNPVPDLDFLNPAATVAGSGDLELYAFGSGFAVGSQVVWAGVAQVTTRISDGQLHCTILAALVASPGPISVRVDVPGPGGGSSGTVTFTVQP
jgi:hypothetical protein